MIVLCNAILDQLVKETAVSDWCCIINLSRKYENDILFW